MKITSLVYIVALLLFISIFTTANGKIKSSLRKSTNESKAKVIAKEEAKKEMKKVKCGSKGTKFNALTKAC